MAKVDEKLKQFMLNNFDFNGMKELGFWPKGTRRNDYEAQAERVCKFFGYKSIYEYNPPELTNIEGENVAVAEFPGAITTAGEYVQGGSALIHTVQSNFTCPICTCPQELGNHNGKKHKCTGCKRKVNVFVDLSGNITAEE